MVEPSKEKRRVWIRTGTQLTEAEKIQKQFDVNTVNKFLAGKGYKNYFNYFKYGNNDVPKSDENTAVLEIPGHRGVAITSGKGLSQEIIDELAKHIGLLSGKWQIYVERENVDEIWRKVKRLCEEKKIWQVKVSTAGSGKSPVIIVYTKNYFDEKDVMAARRELRNIGIEERLYYKPDIYTMLGIYSDNKSLFGISKISKYVD